MRLIPITNGEIYHVYNRGTDKRDIFLDDIDRYRFIKSIKIFNDADRDSNNSIGQTATITTIQNPLVKIHAFCLMSNHFHLLLEQIADNGIAHFMRRLGGYSQYFNKRHERSGTLLEGRYKAKHVDTTEYLIHISRYIHLNPLDIIETDWKVKGIQNWKKAKQFLIEYPWSSLPDYLGYINRGFIDIQRTMSCFKNNDDYMKFVQSWTIYDDPYIEHLTIA